MKSVPRGLIVVAVLILAGLLAFPLREPIYRMIVIPAAFVLWNLDLLYRSFSQGAWWWGIISLVFVMLVLSLVPRARFNRLEAVKPRSPQGQVESLAVWLRKAERGIYFKWLVANRLGKLAYQILLQRESGRPRSVFACHIRNHERERVEAEIGAWIESAVPLVEPLAVYIIDDDGTIRRKE